MLSKQSQQWFIGLSRRLSHADGSFAGVVVANLRLSYFETVFKSAALGKEGNITLSRYDGIVLTRWPYKQEYPGLDISRAALFDHLPQARAGNFETISVTDGLRRLVVYSQVGDFPLVIGVGQSISEIYRQWYEYAFSIGLMIAVLCVVTLFFVGYLNDELRRRRDAEMKLASLAATDSLTGLSNRRHFKEMIRREWQRGVRDRVPLALMMIDIDKFKSYNDTHGHQAGDRLLRAFGTTVGAAMGRGGDIGARFGGDEFAVLLPTSSLDGARDVAERIRRDFVTICAKEGIDPTGLSIGVAHALPAANRHYRELIREADRALYRAKSKGRDRTELAKQDEISRDKAA